MKWHLFIRIFDQSRFCVEAEETAGTFGHITEMLFPAVRHLPYASMAVQAARDLSDTLVIAVLAAGCRVERRGWRSSAHIIGN